MAKAGQQAKEFRARLAQRMAKVAQGTAAAAREPGEADKIGLGVRAVAQEIESIVEPGALWWRAPLQYVAEQAAPRVAKQHEVPEAALDDLRAYLLSGVSEYMIAMCGEFDMLHFEAWAMAAHAQEEQAQAT